VCRISKLCANLGCFFEASENLILLFPLLGPFEIFDLIYGIGYIGFKNLLVVF